MILYYDWVTLVYAQPRFVRIGLKTFCNCCIYKVAKHDCLRYGKIHVTCKDCLQVDFIRVDRERIRTWFVQSKPNMAVDVDHFCNKLEEENMGA